MKKQTGLKTKQVEGKSKSKDSVATRPRERFSQLKDPTGTGEQILDLQRTIGNQAIQRLMKSGTIRAKLNVGTPGDKYEQEADRIAGKMMSMPEPGSEKEDQHVQAKHIVNQTSGDSSNVASNINSLKGSGQALTQSSRAFFESRFGKDLSQVRVHIGSRAAQTAKSLNARAFTTGTDVVFAEGEYSPGTSSGKRLLAHELTHVFQQGSARLIRRTPDHKVVKGDTLYSLSRKYGVSVDDIKKANGLTSDTILEGQVLKIPSSRPATHTVVKGDTLYSLGRKYGVSVDELKKANGLTSDIISEGQVLKIPPAPGKSPTAPPAPAPAPTSPPASPASPIYPGHEPGSDYSKGEVLERSFLRTANKSSIQKYKGNNIFFEKGQQVELISESGFWIEVRGNAYYDTKAPKQVLKSTSPGPPQPDIRTGWIKRKWTDMTKGKYQHLAIDDRSFETGELGYNKQIPKKDVKQIVLHQTDASTASSTLETYKKNIKKGSHRGAHYLIGKDGKIYLTVPVDRKVSHIAPDIPGKKHITNEVSLGIEHVGTANKITPNKNKYKSAAWKTDMKRVRADVKALDLSPAFKAKLLALSDRDLYYKLKWSGWKVYGDITGAQKRSTHLLTQRMMKDFGLTINDLVAHEEAQKKTMGEGENIKEFLLTMNEYPKKVKTLRTIANSNSTLSGSTDFMNIVTHEEALVNAIQLDATQKENDDLAKEKASNTNGPATKREAMRVSFYNDFYKRVKQLDEMIAYLNSKGTSDMTTLKSKIAAWRK